MATARDVLLILTVIIVCALCSMFVTAYFGSVAAARATCLEHPTWHYDGPGTLSPATCKPPESES